MRTLFVGALAVTLVGCGCLVSSQAALKPAQARAAASPASTGPLSVRRLDESQDRSTRIPRPQEQAPGWHPIRS